MPARMLGPAAATALVILAALLCGPQFGSGAAAGKGWPTKAEGEFLVVETPHYIVRTDMGADVGQLIASHQEVLFTELYRRMAGNKAGAFAVQRASILIVGNKDKYLALMGPDAKGSQGTYTPVRNQISGWGSKDQMDDLLETLRHEGTHQFVQQFIGAKCPVWLNEGLAEFFKHAQFSGGQLTTGQAPIYLVNDLKRAQTENRLIPVQKMLTTTPEAWNATLRKEGSDAYTQYHQAWAMVHFLQGAESGKYRDAFVQYIYYLARGRDSSDAWQKAFGGDVAGFEKRLFEYLKDLKPTGGMGCRTNLGFLGFMLLNVREGVDPPKDIATFYQWALEGKLSDWTFTTGSGLKVSTEDPGVMKSLFRCPEDKSKDDEPSYELAPGKPGEPAVVRCRHHVGFVLETAYEKDPKDGKMQAAVVARPPASVPPPPKAPPAAKTPPARKGAPKP